MNEVPLQLLVDTSHKSPDVGYGILLFMPAKPSLEQVREFVIAGHGELAKVQSMLSADAELLNEVHEWKSDDHETAIMGAAHVGNVPIAEYLLSKGAPLAIYTAAMLGRASDVRRMVRTDPTSVRLAGAHAIPLLAHAAHCGDVDLCQFLFESGARTGGAQAAAHAIGGGHTALALWLISATNPDSRWKNFRGKTLLDIAAERGMEEVVQRLTT